MKQPPRFPIATPTADAAAGSEPQRAAPPDGELRHGEAPARPPEAPDSLITFWDELFCAVRTRLRQTMAAAAQAPSARGVETSGLTTQQMRVDVLDCIAALDQLHKALSQEVGRNVRTGQALLQAQAELTRVRAELAGTRIGLPAGSVILQAHGASGTRPGLFRVPSDGGPEPAPTPHPGSRPRLRGTLTLLHGGVRR